MSAPIPNRSTDILCVVILVTTGVACQLNDGNLARLALRLMTVALFASLLAVLRPARPTPGEWPWARRLMLGALLFEMATCTLCYPGGRWSVSMSEPVRQVAQAWNDWGWSATIPQWVAGLGQVLEAERQAAQPVMIAGFAALSALGLASIRLPDTRWPLVLLLGGYLGLGAYWLEQTRPPGIDTYLAHQEGLRSLLHGENPYAMTYPDLYPDGKGAVPREYVKDGMVITGLAYPPLSLFAALPGYVAFGDHRYSQLAAFVLSVWLIATCRPGPTPRIAALLLLFWPRAMMLVEFAFSEPFLVLALAGTVWNSIRRPRWTAVSFGLLIAMKQYTLFMAPLGLLLVPRWAPREIARFLGVSIAAATFVTAPLVLVSVDDAFRALVAAHMKAPLTSHALCYPAYSPQFGVPRETALRFSYIAFPIALAAVGTALVRFQRGGSAFALGIVVVYIPFLLLAKQAFGNYYFTVVAAAACCVAARERPPTETTLKPLALGHNAADRDPAYSGASLPP